MQAHVRVGSSRAGGDKGAQHAVAQLALSGSANTLMPVHPLMQLTGSTRPATTVRKRKIVEHEQLAGLRVQLDLDVPDAKAVPREERQL